MRASFGRVLGSLAAFQQERAHRQRHTKLPRERHRDFETERVTNNNKDTNHDTVLSVRPIALFLYDVICS